MKSTIFNLSVFLLLNFVETARIICVFSVPHYSHQSVLKVVPEELAKHGHQLVVITPEPYAKNIENITQIDVKEIDVGWEQEVVGVKRDTFAIKPDEFLTTAMNTLVQISDAQFNVKEVQDLIKGEDEFDLIIAEDCSRASALIGARFKAPIVLVSSFSALDESFTRVQSETNPILFPFHLRKPTHFWKRMMVFLDYVKITLGLSLDEKYNALIRKHFGETAPLVGEVRKNVKMVLLSMNRMWDNNRAITPSVIYMGAIHLKEPRPLPKNLQYFLDYSKRGVIIMSLGSKIKSSDLPTKTLQKVIRVFQSLPYDILWKWDGGHLGKCPDNVRLEKWLPQTDLLRHPSIKAFITHGGLQSTDEAIAAGVPLIGLPVLGDQYQNVQKYREYGIGVELDIDNLDERELRQAVIEVAEDRSYRDNVERLRRIISDQRTPGLVRAVNRIHHLLDHGSYTIDDVTAFEYYVIDVLIVIAAVLIVTFAFISFAVKFIFISLRCSLRKCKFELCFIERFSCIQYNFLRKTRKLSSNVMNTLLETCKKGLLLLIFYLRSKYNSNMKD